MKVAIYSRVSSTEAQQRQNPDMQLAPMFEHCSKQTWQVFDKYVDFMTGGGSKGKSRPELNRMMIDARHGKFDCVLVWKLDRIARSLQDFVYLVGELKRINVRFMVLTQPIDTSEDTPTGRMLMNMLMCFAEFERDLTQERIKARIKFRKDQGLPVGREKVIVNSNRILELRTKGASVREIAEKLGVTKSTIQNRLKEMGNVPKGYTVEVMVDDLVVSNTVDDLGEVCFE